MKNKTFFKFLSGLIIGSATACSAYAAETGMIGSLISPFGKLEVVYGKFGPFIDAMIYLIIFLGISQATLGKQFDKSKGGRAIVIGVGLVLAIGLSLFGVRTGFNIASFGPIAAIILISLMGFAFYTGITSFEIEGVDKLTIAAIAYLLFYYGVQATVPNVIMFINSNVPVVGGLLAMLALGFTIYVIVMMVKFAMSLFGGKESSTTEEGTRSPGGLTPQKRGGETPERSNDFEDQLNTIQSMLLSAKNNLGKSADEISSRGLIHLGKWGDDHKNNPALDDVRKEAKKIVDIIKGLVLPPVDDAKDNLIKVITQAKHIIDSSKFTDEAKKRVRHIRHETEGSHEHIITQIKNKRIESSIKALNDFAEGRGKRTSDSVGKYVGDHMRHALNEIKNIGNHIDVTILRVRELLDVAEHPEKSSGSGRKFAITR